MLKEIIFVSETLHDAGRISVEVNGGEVVIDYTTNPVIGDYVELKGGVWVHIPRSGFMDRNGV